MNQHTPGPWFVSGSMTKYVEARIEGGLIQEVAAIGPTAADEGYGGQQFANATLIAAAPGLLAILEHLVEMYGEGISGVLAQEVMLLGKDWDRAREMIVKARGEQP